MKKKSRSKKDWALKLIINNVEVCDGHIFGDYNEWVK
jgi:hypothetical protein